jgi:hypothetical protein
MKKKKKRNLQDIIVVIQMYEIVKIQMQFWSDYLIFWLNFFYKCLNLGEKIKNENYLFSFGQNMKKIIMVKVGCFCMGQRMM